MRGVFLVWVIIVHANHLQIYLTPILAVPSLGTYVSPPCQTNHSTVRRSRWRWLGTWSETKQLLGTLPIVLSLVTFLFLSRSMPEKIYSILSNLSTYIPKLAPVSSLRPSLLTNFQNSLPLSCRAYSTTPVVLSTFLLCPCSKALQVRWVTCVRWARS